MNDKGTETELDALLERWVMAAHLRGVRRWGEMPDFCKELREITLKVQGPRPDNWREANTWNFCAPFFESCFYGRLEDALRRFKESAPPDNAEIPERWRFLRRPA